MFLLSMIYILIAFLISKAGNKIKLSIVLLFMHHCSLLLLVIVCLSIVLNTLALDADYQNHVFTPFNELPSEEQNH